MPGLGLSLGIRSRSLVRAALAGAARGLADLILERGAALGSINLSKDFTGGSLAYALAPSSAPLPAGLSLSAAGVLSGTPTQVAPAASIVIRGANATGFADSGFTLTVEPAATVGFRASRNEGTVGDLFVAQGKGSDATGTGSLATPFATIGRAVQAAGLGQHIKARTGTYREVVDLAPKGLTLSRYGTDVVTIHGGDPISGWAPCDAADAAVLGPTLGTAGSPIHKVTVPLSTLIDSDPRTANFHEAGAKLAPAMLWKAGARRPHFIFAADQYLTFDPITMQDTNPTTSTRVLGFRSPEVVAAYSAAQLLNCEMVGVEAPNANFRKPVGSIVGDAIYMQGASAAGWAAGYEELHLDTATGHANHFALVNLLPALRRGQWGYKVNGSNVTFYLWPREVANLAAGIEIAHRGQGVKLGSNSEVRGLRFKQQASGPLQANEMNPISMGGTNTKKTNVRVRNCLIENYTHVYFGYGAIWAANTDDGVFQDITIRGMYGAFGWFLAGGNSPIGALSRNNLVERVVVESCEYSPFRIFCQRECLVTRCVAGRDCGVGAHANKANFYTTCHRCVFHACNFVGATGYLTWQRASAVAVIGCWVPCSYIGGDLRAIDDQNDPTDTTLPSTSFGESKHSYILCNALPPYGGYPLDPSGGASLLLGGAQALTYTVKGNILHGTGNTVGDGFVTEASHNVMTRGAAFGTAGAVSTAGAVYADPATGDHRYAAGSPVRTLARPDVSVEIAAVKAWLSANLAARLDVDLAGRSIDWSRAPVGPLDDYDGILEMSDFWIDLPTFSSAPIVGEPLSLVGGYWAGRSRPVPTAQWHRAADLSTWSSIDGQTAESYTPDLSDVGRGIGVAITAGTDAVFLETSKPVVAAYALGNPTPALAVFPVGGTGGASPEFALQDRPVVVLVFDRNGASTASPKTVTVGAPGRSAGSGTAIPQKGLHIRNQAQVSGHFLAAPGSGQRTIRVEGSGLNAEVMVLYVDRATDLSTGTGSGITGAQRATSIATTSPNGTVLHAAVKSDSSGAPLTVAGASSLGGGNTGGVGPADAHWAAAWERAPDAGATHTATFHQPGGGSSSMITAAFEVRS